MRLQKLLSRCRAAVAMWMMALTLPQLLPAQMVQWSSPGNQLQVQAGLNPSGSFVYNVFMGSEEVVAPSQLGFVLKEPALDLRRFRLLGIDSVTVDATWQPVWGEVSRIRNHYKEVHWHLETANRPAIRINIVFRLFDDGLGFRYEFPEQEGLQHFVVQDERTEFHVAQNHTAWWLPGDYDTNEYFYNTTPLNKIDARVADSFNEIGVRRTFHPLGVQTPLLLKSNSGVYISVHEAALINYPAMQLVVDTQRFNLQAHLVPDAVGNKAYLQTPFVTPWRTLVISRNATDLLASKLILNLNEPCALEDVSWIRPHKMMGVWWEMHVGKSSWDYSGGRAGTNLTGKVPHGANTANVKRYIDFAAANGIEGVLVEGWNIGWEDWYGKWKENVFDFVTPYPDFDLEYLTTYAREKAVKLVMHHETSASATNYERFMDTAYRLMQRYGYDAVKTGYVGRIIPRGEHHDGQWMVNHYNRVAEKTAGYRIMVDMHESVRPTGLHRTWPNWLASEAARGNEFNAWSRGNPPAHETILPFTRLMGGPMDYTPGIFKIKMSHYRPGATEQVHTTLAKQLALYVTLYSPLQMAADLVENYEARPDAFQFIKEVPVDWDDSRYLAAEPGAYVAVARKQKVSPNWFVGAITNETARTLALPLQFLDNKQVYTATLYRDAADAHWQHNPEAYVIEKVLVTAGTTLQIPMAAGGGYAISLLPATNAERKQLKPYKARK